MVNRKLVDFIVTYAVIVFALLATEGCPLVTSGF